MVPSHPYTYYCGLYVLALAGCLLRFFLTLNKVSFRYEYKETSDYNIAADISSRYFLWERICLNSLGVSNIANGSHYAICESG
jgi:hypothetical protein